MARFIHDWPSGLALLVTATILLHQPCLSEAERNPAGTYRGHCIHPAKMSQFELVLAVMPTNAVYMAEYGTLNGNPGGCVYRASASHSKWNGTYLTAAMQVQADDAWNCNQKPSRDLQLEVTPDGYGGIVRLVDEAGPYECSCSKTVIPSTSVQSPGLHQHRRQLRTRRSVRISAAESGSNVSFAAAFSGMLEQAAEPLCPAPAQILFASNTSKSSNADSGREALIWWWGACKGTHVDCLYFASGLRKATNATADNSMTDSDTVRQQELTVLCPSLMNTLCLLGHSSSVSLLHVLFRGGGALSRLTVCSDTVSPSHLADTLQQTTFLGSFDFVLGSTACVDQFLATISVNSGATDARPVSLSTTTTTASVEFTWGKDGRGRMRTEVDVDGPLQ